MILNPQGRPASVRQDVRSMTPYQARLFADLAQMLRAIGWQITCPRCTKLFGYGKDGVRANNSEGDGSNLRAECGCIRLELDRAGGVRH